MTAAAVRPMPTLRFATMKLEVLDEERRRRGRGSYVSVDWLSSLKDFFIALVTQIMPIKYEKPPSQIGQRKENLPRAKATPRPTTTP